MAKSQKYFICDFFLQKKRELFSYFSTCCPTLRCTPYAPLNSFLLDLILPGARFFATLISSSVHNK